MNTGIVTVTLLALTLGAVGCASRGEPVSGAAASRTCFQADRVSGFEPVDNTTVRLRVGVKDTYEATLLGYCPDVDWTQRIALRSVSGSSMICTNDAMGWEILVLDRPGIGPDRCRVRAIRKLEPDAAAKP